jgi:hypothetical protein
MHLQWKKTDRTVVTQVKLTDNPKKNQPAGLE